MSALLFAATGVSKTFGSVRVLRNVTIEIRPGEIHGLVGPNGSGKSTLIKILTGVYSPDRGAELISRGMQLPLPLTKPHEYGIAVIHQDLGLDPQMTVLENLGVVAGYGTRSLGPIMWKAERHKAVKQMDRFGYLVPLDRLVKDITPAERALVAVLRADRMLGERDGGEGKLFILDEPTAYLNEADSERLRIMMRRVAADGNSVLFVSHFLPEILQTCDRVSVIRDGAIVDTRMSGEFSEQSLIELMLNRSIGDYYPAPPPGPPGKPRLVAQGLCGVVVDGVDLHCRQGELVGITGLTGSGFEEMASLLMGASTRKGTVAIDGIPLRCNVREAVKAGMVIIPADRKREGVWVDGSASENISLPVLDDYRHRRILSPSREVAGANALMTQLQVTPNRPEQLASRFSGGNQQKIVIAKWLQVKPRVLVLEEPTQGVDAGARKDILNLINSLIAEGSAGVICSADHEQLAAVCNRVLIMRGGRLVEELEGDEISEDAILAACQTIEN